MLNNNFYNLFFVSNFLVSKRWLILNKFYYKMRNFNFRLIVLKTRYFVRAKYHKVNHYWRKKWIKFKISTSFAKAQFLTGFKQKIRVNSLHRRRFKKFRKNSSLCDIFKNHYTFINNSTKLNLFKSSSSKNWTYSTSSRFRFLSNPKILPFGSSKLGLFNLYMKGDDRSNEFKAFSMRKAMYTLPERNKPTWMVIRSIFRPRKIHQLPINYYKPNEALLKLRPNFKRRSFVPKIFFNNSLYMYVRKRRKSVKDYFNLKYLYQKKLTKFLFQFKLLSVSSIFRVYHNNVHSLVKKSSILVSYNNMNLFFSKKWIFLNGCVVKSDNFYVFKGDLISFYFNWKVLQFLINSFYSINKNRHILNRYYYLFVLKKRKRKSVQYWVNKYDTIKLKSLDFIDVDFSTLSIFVLVDYDFRDHLNRQPSITIPYGVLLNFNWKFIN